MSEFNEIIHQSARLRILCALSALDDGERMDFRTLAEMLGLTDGNLGAHLTKLEEARYVQVKKTFVGRKPRTSLAMTARGRVALASHIQALRDMLDSI